jgi:phosphoribosyl 1,2-cyclic phosphate phosphodiesterase
MRFTFLGTGTSSGIPLIGCDCAVCRSDDPRDKRLRCSAALQWIDASGRERTVLIDAGPDLRQQALRAGLTRCDGIFFTHNHVDHVFGLDEVRRFNAVMQKPIDIYADANTLESLRRVYKHIFDRDQNVNDSFVATLVPHLIRPETPIDLFGVRFTPFAMLHGHLPVLSYRVEWSPKGAEVRGTGSGWAKAPAKTVAAPVAPAPASERDDLFPLAYCTDVSGIPPESWKHLKGLKTLVLDALRHRKHATHFTIGQAESVGREARSDRTYFIHMTHDLAHAKTDAELPEGMHLAYDGLVLGD